MMMMMIINIMMMIMIKQIVEVIKQAYILSMTMVVQTFQVK